MLYLRSKCKIHTASRLTMSFGFSPGDVIEALKVTKQICEVWFDKVKRAGKQAKGISCRANLLRGF